MANKNVLDKFIYPVKQYNELQKESYREYCEECIKNGVEPAPQQRYFPTIDYKTGYVLAGKYPIYKRRKKDLY